LPTPIDVAPEMLRLVDVLERGGVRYMVTGAAAIAVYGVARPTSDVDVAVLGNRQEVIEVLGRHGYRLVLSSQSYEHLRVFESPGGMRVDIWFTPDIPWEVASFERRRRIQVGGQSVPFITPEDLIVRKLWRYRTQGGTQDVEDVRGILDVTKGLDMDYLRQMTRITRTSAILEEILREHVGREREDSS